MDGRTFVIPRQQVQNKSWKIFNFRPFNIWQMFAYSNDNFKFVCLLPVFIWFYITWHQVFGNSNLIKDIMDSCWFHSKIKIILKITIFFHFHSIWIRNGAHNFFVFSCFFSLDFNFIVHSFHPLHTQKKKIFQEIHKWKCFSSLFCSMVSYLYGKMKMRKVWMKENVFNGLWNSFIAYF